MSATRSPCVTYLHPECFTTSKPRDQIEFIGQSVPWYDEIRGEVAARLSDLPTLPATQCDLVDFERVHDPEYLSTLAAMGRDQDVAKRPTLNAECSGMWYALPGYRYTLGGMMEALRRMRKGELDRAYVFGPPGHHAHADWGHGYCLLNPQAAAGRHAQELGFAHPLIIDWDFHHGDGTQTIFAGDTTVHHVSIHSAIDLYMSMVEVTELGTTVAADEAGHQNIPVLSSFYPDEFWDTVGLAGRFYRAPEAMDAFDQALDCVPWSPDIVLIFSGYDAHKDDCGEEVHAWNYDDFETLTRRVCAFADRHGAPILSVHGGGYRKESVVEAAVRHVRVLGAR